MNFLITGAAGFLGSALANQLAREGHQVRGIDDLSTGDPQALSPDVHFTRGDVNGPPQVVDLASGSGLCLPPGSPGLRPGNRCCTRASTMLLM